MGSPVDDALDLLRGFHRGDPFMAERVATVRSALEQLREERDGWEKIAESRALYAHKQAARMGAHASAPQPTPVSGVPLAATSKASEGAEDGTGIDTRYRGRAEAAEAEVQRYREGLREIAEMGLPDQTLVVKARALLSASPTDGEPGWFLYHVPSNNVVGEAPTLKEAQAMHAEWVKADERNATEIEVLAFERDGGGAK